MAINFYDKDVKVPVFKRRELKKELNRLVEKKGRKTGSINFIFVSDDELLNMNKKFLKHDYYTDVISFDYSLDEMVDGDIYMSIERMKENAMKFGVSVKNEIYRVTAHGLLHLLGYKDGNKEEKDEMKKNENDFLDNMC